MTRRIVERRASVDADGRHRRPIVPPIRRLKVRSSRLLRFQSRVSAGVNPPRPNTLRMCEYLPKLRLPGRQGRLRGGPRADRGAQGDFLRVSGTTRSAELIEPSLEERFRGRRAVVAVDRAGDSESPRVVERDRRAVDRRGDRADDAADILRRPLDERLIQQPGPAASPLLRRDARELDICAVTLSRGTEPGEEPGEYAAGTLGDEARVTEMVEEQPRQRAMDRAPPPVVDHGDNAVVVGWLRRPE